MYQINLARLKQCMCRANQGEEMTIAFLGGSITQGSNASSRENSYAYRVFSWWKESFPQAEFHYVNGGIGGTTSHFGVARAVSDVLMYQPDFVVVDFSVNDDADLLFQETYEGVIRKLLLWPSKPAVVILNNVFYDTGMNAQAYHNAVGKWYMVPYVSVMDTLYQSMKAGKYNRLELTEDGLHPNDKGHSLVAKEITAFLQTVKEHMLESEEENRIPEAMTFNAYEKAEILSICNTCPKLDGFRADAEEKLGHLDFFKNGWIGRKKGDRIVFEVEASCIAVQYRKTLKKPAACAMLVIDGDKEQSVLLDGNFNETWGECLYLEPVLHHGAKKMHTIEIEIVSGEDRAYTPFYLLSLIVA